MSDFKAWREERKAAAPAVAPVEASVDPSVQVAVQPEAPVPPSIKLPLDNESVSDCLIPFRLLSSREHDEIMDEMNKLKYIKNVDTQYNSYLISKMLSKASSDNPSSTPKLSELSLRSTLTRDMLLATGIRYNEFVQQTSPHIEWLTEEDIKHFIEDINSQEDITKKFDILNGLSLKQTQGVLLNLLNKLETITKQLDKFVTGS